METEIRARIGRVESDSSANETTEVPIPTTDGKSEDFKFDIVEYARMRKRLLIKRDRDLENRRKARERTCS